MGEGAGPGMREGEGFAGAPFEPAPLQKGAGRGRMDEDG